MKKLLAIILAILTIMTYGCAAMEEQLEEKTEGYTFTIKNNHEIYPSVVFKFVPAVIGRTSIELKYAEDSNIVVNSCNVLQEIEFN